MFDCVLINGDSYSQLTSEHKVYSEFLSESLDIPIINIAKAGSNNKRIVRSTLEKLLELKQTFSNPLVIIGWSFIKRIEVWYYGNNPSVIGRIPDCTHSLEHLRPKLVTLDVLTSLGEATLEQKCLISDDLFVHKQLIDFYTDLYMLAHTIKSLDSEFLCFSAAKNVETPIHCFPYIESLQQVKWCVENKNIHQLHDFCIMQWAQHNDTDSHPVTGHLSEQGHKNFAVMLENWIHPLTGVQQCI
jgi:hypothetical protein